MSRDIVVKARKSGFNKEELDPGTRSQARFFLQNQSGWGKILADIRLSRINSQIENSADMWLPRCNLVSFRLKSDRRTVTNTTSNSITMANKSGRPYLQLKSSISKKTISIILKKLVLQYTRIQLITAAFLQIQVVNILCAISACQPQLWRSGSRISADFFRRLIFLTNSAASG